MGLSNSREQQEHLINKANIIEELTTYLKDFGNQSLQSNGKLSFTPTTLAIVNDLVRQVPSLSAARDRGLLRRRHQWRLSCGVVTWIDEAKTWDVELIKTIIESVHCLQVKDPDNSYNSRNVDVGQFTSLSWLELSGVAIQRVQHLKKLRATLQTLIVYKGIESLQSLFEVCGGDQSFPGDWTALQAVVLRGNGLGHLDDSLRLFPVLTVLDLSRNALQTTHGIEHLKTLESLNLSYNFLSELPPLAAEAKAKLKVLLISFNHLDTLQGIDAFTALEVVDARDNCILVHSDLSGLCQLDHLLQLRLIGNPMSLDKRYRLNVLDMLSPKSNVKLSLDNRPLSNSEHLYLHKMPVIMLAPSTPSRPDPTPSGLQAAVARPALHTSLPSGSALVTSTSAQSTPRAVLRRKVVILAEGETRSRPGADSEADVSSSDAEGRTPLSTSVERTRAHISETKRRYKENWLLNFKENMERLGVTPPLSSPSQLEAAMREDSTDAPETQDETPKATTIYDSESQNCSSEQESGVPSSHLAAGQSKPSKAGLLSCLKCNSGFFKEKAARRTLSANGKRTGILITSPDGVTEQLLCPLCHSDLIWEQEKPHKRTMSGGVTSAPNLTSSLPSQLLKSRLREKADSAVTSGDRLDGTSSSSNQASSFTEVALGEESEEKMKLEELNVSVTSSEPHKTHSTVNEAGLSNIAITSVEDTSQTTDKYNADQDEKSRQRLQLQREDSPGYSSQMPDYMCDATDGPVTSESDAERCRFYVGSNYSSCTGSPVQREVVANESSPRHQSSVDESREMHKKSVRSTVTSQEETEMSESDERSTTETPSSQLSLTNQNPVISSEFSSTNQNPVISSELSPNQMDVVPAELSVTNQSDVPPSELSSANPNDVASCEVLSTNQNAVASFDLSSTNHNAVPPSELSATNHNAVASSELSATNQSDVTELPPTNKKAVTQRYESNDWLQFNYSDFSKMDHNLRLYFDVSVMEKEEEALLLIKCMCVTNSRNQAFPGLVLVSNNRFIVFEWKEHESHEVAKCVKQLDRSDLVRISRVETGLCGQWLGVEFNRPQRYYSLLTGDSVVTENFLQQLKDVLTTHVSKLSDKKDLFTITQEQLSEKISRKFLRSSTDKKDDTGTNFEGAFLVKKMVQANEKSRPTLDPKDPDSFEIIPGESMCLLCLSARHVCTVVLKLSSKQEVSFALDRRLEVIHVQAARRDGPRTVTLKLFPDARSDDVTLNFISASTLNTAMATLGRLWENVFMVSFEYL